LAQSSGNGPESIDALPYIDAEFDSVEDEVNQMIENEMDTFDPPNYLEKFPPLDLSFNKLIFVPTELERIRQRRAPDPIDTKRLDLFPPPLNKEKDLGAWKDTLNNACAQLEHQHLRLQNLELLQDYGANSWIQYNKYLEGIQRSLSHELNQVKKQTEKINKERKSEQIAAGAAIRNLETTWIYQIQKNQEILNACSSLEKEIELYGLSDKDNNNTV